MLAQEADAEPFVVECPPREPFTASVGRELPFRWVRYWPTFGGGHLEASRQAMTEGGLFAEAKVDEASCFVVGAAVQLSESALGLQKRPPGPGWSSTRRSEIFVQVRSLPGQSWDASSQRLPSRLHFSGPLLSGDGAFTDRQASARSPMTRGSA